MAYTVKNFKTKKALKEALLAGEQIDVYQPGPFSDSLPRNGTVYLEGPHYPAPHSWYAKGVVRDGVLVQVDTTKAPAGQHRELHRGGQRVAWIGIPKGSQVEREKERVARYLPENYRITGTTRNEHGETVLVVKGHDVAGWTLDGYVLPRLHSGLIGGQEVHEGQQRSRAETRYEVWTSPTYTPNPGGWGKQRTFRTFKEAHDLRSDAVRRYPYAVVVRWTHEGEETDVRVVEGPVAAFMRDMDPDRGRERNRRRLGRRLGPVLRIGPGR